MSDILSSAAPEMVGELIAVCERLREVLRAETQLIERQGEQNFGAYTVEKSQLVVRYDRLLQALANMPADMLRGLDNFTLLQHGLHSLTELIQKNARVIEVRLKATRRVMEVVARAARKATQPNFTYGTGRLGYGIRQSGHTAIAVNRVL